jgi:hypothetical protein
MIFDVIIEGAMAVLSFLLSLLPDWEPLDFSGAIADLSGSGAPAEGIGGIFNTVAYFNLYLPIAEAVFILQIMLGMMASVYLVKFLLWGLTKLHVLGGSS